MLVKSTTRCSATKGSPVGPQNYSHVKVIDTPVLLFPMRKITPMSGITT